MKYRWYSTVELYDSDNLCGFGYETTIQVEVTTNADMSPAEPEVGVMYDQWNLDYDFKPTTILPIDDNWNYKEPIDYESLPETTKEKVTKFCEDNTKEIEEKANDKSPSNYDINDYKVSS